MHHCSPFSGFAVQKQEFADPRFGICLFLHGNDILYPVSGHYGKSAAGIAFYAYIIPFFISTAMGAVISGIIVFSIKKAGLLVKIQDNLAG